MGRCEHRLRTVRPAVRAMPSTQRRRRRTRPRPSDATPGYSWTCPAGATQRGHSPPGSKAARVDRHELLHETPTTRPIRFHDLRGTGITWRAFRDDPKFEIQVDAGHTDFSTTEKYLQLVTATKRKAFGT